MKKLLLPALLVLIALTGSILSVPLLPDRVATGSNNAFTSKGVILWMLPAFMFIVAACIGLIPMMGLEKKSPQTIGPLKSILNGTLCGLLLVHGLILAYGLGYNINLNIMNPLITGIVFILIGTNLPRIRKHQVKTENDYPLSVHSRAQQNMQSFLARVFVAGGILMLISILTPGAASLTAFIMLLALTLVGTLGGLLYYYRSIQK